MALMWIHLLEKMGEAYGKLTDVFVTGANDVYEITAPDGKKHLVPAIRDVIVNTDIQAGVMLIRPLKGLFGPRLRYKK